VSLYALGFNNKQSGLIPRALEIHEDRCVGRDRGVLWWKRERLAYALFVLATAALFKASLITRPLYCRNIRHAAQSYLFSSEEPDASFSRFLKRHEGKGVAANNTETSYCLPTISYIGTDIVFFTNAVAERIQCINAGLSLGAPDSCCVHFALFNDACWGDTGIPPLTSALSGPRARQHRFHDNRRHPTTMARHKLMHHVAVEHTMVIRARSQTSVIRLHLSCICFVTANVQLTVNMNVI